MWTDATEIDGTIIDFSDAGVMPQMFAVVEVQQTRNFVVPVSKLIRKDN